VCDNKERERDRGGKRGMGGRKKVRHKDLVKCIERRKGER
jgi:hypothetical protein